MAEDPDDEREGEFALAEPVDLLPLGIVVVDIGEIREVGGEVVAGIDECVVADNEEVAGLDEGAVDADEEVIGAGEVDLLGIGVESRRRAASGRPRRAACCSRAWVWFS